MPRMGRPVDLVLRDTSTDEGSLGAVHAASWRSAEKL